MAFTASMVLEVRTTGDDTNGGGFAGGGTDYSQQDVAQFSFSDLVIDATTNTLVSSASHSFVGTDVGNILNVISGTGFTVGRYQVTGTSGGKATLDRAVGTLGSTGGVWKLGGAIASWGIAGAITTVADQKVYVRAGTYNVTSGTVNVSGGIVQTQARVHWEGYQTTRGDQGTPPVLFNSSGQTGKTFFDNSGQQGARLINLSIDGNNGASNIGMATGPFGFVFLCRVYNCPNYGFNGAQECNVINCYAEHCGGGFYHSFIGRFYACTSKNAVNWGFQMDGSCMLVNCIAHGAGQAGYVFQSRTLCINCVAYGNGQDGFNCLAGGDRYQLINCIAEGNGRYGVSLNGLVWLIDMATYNNTSGAMNGVPSFNQSPITGSAGFFVNGAAGNFALNTTAGGGALLKGIGYPQAFLVNGTITAPDIGAAQSGGAGGAGGGGVPRVYAYTT